MKIKKILLLVLFIFSLFFIACGDKEVTVSISGDGSVKVNKSITLVAKASDGSNEFDWSSSDESIAIVENGVVKGISIGDVTITVALKNNDSVKATKKITVEASDEEKFEITVSQDKVDLSVGDTFTIEASVTPKTDLVWSSSDYSVVNVENGKINALKAGSAIITVSTSDGKAKKEITVIVAKVEEGYTSQDLMKGLLAIKEEYSLANSVNMFIETKEGTCEMIYNIDGGVYKEFKYSVIGKTSSNVYIKDGILYSNLETAKTKNTLSVSEAESIAEQYNASVFLEDVTSFYDEDAFFLALNKKQETSEFVEFELVLNDYLGSLPVAGIDEVIIRATLENGKITSVELVYTTKGVSDSVKVYYRGTTQQTIEYPSDLDSYEE